MNQKADAPVIDEYSVIHSMFIFSEGILYSRSCLLCIRRRGDEASLANRRRRLGGVRLRFRFPRRRKRYVPVQL
jgi:hypothetical protein